jgi:hypothetical protein
VDQESPVPNPETTPKLGPSAKAGIRDIGIGAVIIAAGVVVLWSHERFEFAANWFGVYALIAYGGFRAMRGYFRLLGTVP